jgi:nicotinate-nucleotide pyrophosphorylase
MTQAFEPDWKALSQVSHIKYKITIQLIIEEYRRQKAAQGLVEVRADDLSTVRAHIAALADWVMSNEAPDIEDELRSLLRTLDRILSAPEEQS